MIFSKDESNAESNIDVEKLDYVFEVSKTRDKIDFITWLLEIPDDECQEGLKNIRATNAAFSILYDILNRVRKCTIVYEDNYVDRVYRDSYYFHYSGKHFDYARFCKRICLFSGEIKGNFYECDSKVLEKKFIGSIVIQPIPGRSVGRTLLNPKYILKLKPGYIRLGDYNITVYGKRLHVRAFPFSMQDGETTSCAEITILNLLDYFSQTYSEYRYLLPSSISLIAEQNSYERRIPTTGLSYEIISKIFCEAGFYPRLYATNKMEKAKFKRILHYYIESGIPVALGLKVNEDAKHSVIGIGYTTPNRELIDRQAFCAFDVQSFDAIWICDTADTVNSYCIMDDNTAPYTIYECEEKNDKSNHKADALYLEQFEVEYLMVPLYKRMYLEASDAYEICMNILASKDLGINTFAQNNIAFTSLKNRYFDVENIGSKDNPLVIRLFMASSRSFRKHRDLQIVNDEVRYIYNYTTFPKFIWVCEIATRQMYMSGKILGEIIIDATSSADAKTSSFIIIQYPGVICSQLHNAITDCVEPKFEGISGWTEYPCFDGNLQLFK